jgi:hypothetical protein
MTGFAFFLSSIAPGWEMDLDWWPDIGVIL